MPKLKVHGGTAHFGGSSLCVTCKYATIIKGESLDQEIISCGEIPKGRIYFKVTSCNSYRDQNRPSLREMEQIAWVLQTDKKRQIGFVKMKDLKGDDRPSLAGDYDDWD